MPDPAQEAAYRASLYCVDVGGRWIERRVGAVDPEADEALAALGCRRHWIILTPCNPGSVPLTAEDNARRLAELRAAAIRAGWRHLPSENRAADGSWPEPGLCLLDADMERARELAVRFGQSAFVHGALGARLRLIWTTDVSLK